LRRPFGNFCKRQRQRSSRYLALEGGDRVVTSRLPRKSSPRSGDPSQLGLDLVEAFFPRFTCCPRQEKEKLGETRPDARLPGAESRKTRAPRSRIGGRRAAGGSTGCKSLQACRLALPWPRFRDVVFHLGSLVVGPTPHLPWKLHHRIAQALC
jgi:hypothetical protein